MNARYSAAVGGHMREHRDQRGVQESKDGPVAETDGDGRVFQALLYTPAQAAELLAVKESWLRRKAGRRTIPCTFLGKHLRFSDENLRTIIESGTQATLRAPRRRRV